MSYTYDLTTSVGKVRVWIRDNDASNVLFTDEEITAMLGMNENDIRATAAACLYALASNKALLSRMISAGKYSEDNRRGAAQELRDTAKAILDGGNTPWDGVIEQTFENPCANLNRLNDPNAREFIEKEYIRNEVI